LEEKWKDYFYKGLASFLTIAMCILFFFVIFRFEELRQYIALALNILRPFVFGMVIAYLVAPLCNLLETRMMMLINIEKKSSNKSVRLKKLISSFSIVLGLLLFCMIIYALIAMVVPQVIDSVLVLFDSMPAYITKTSKWVEKMVADNPVLLNYVEQYSTDILENVQEFAKVHLIPNINNIISGVSTSLWTAVNFLKDLVIGLIVAVYMLNSRKVFRRQAKMVIRAVFSDKKRGEENESVADWVIREIHIMNTYFGGFIKGKLLDSLIIGLICMVFTTIMDMPYAVLISVVIGVTNIIPFFGPFVGAIPSSFLILLVSPIKCVYFVIFILILQQFDGNILGPKILGDTTNLSSFWVLFAILLFGGLYGVVGMIVGVPLFAFFYQLIREWITRRLKKKNLFIEQEQEAEEE